LVFSFATTTAFADEPTGSIVVNNYREDVEIKIYKLLDLGESYDVDSGKYPYTMTDDWKDFFTTGEGADYITIDSTTNAITWKGVENDARVAEFAKKALEYAKNNSIAAIETSKSLGVVGAKVVPAENGAIKFINLDLGYYLVDSTMGALCGLTTTNPEGVITAKNGVPTVTKQVKEDLTGQWGQTNTADIGQEIEFRATINVHAGAQNYVLHDDLNDKFKFIGVTKIEHITSSSTTTYTEDSAENPLIAIATVKNPSDCEEHNGKTCDFGVEFKSSFCDDLKTNDRVIIYYTAKLNNDANIGNETGNINTVWLSFGETHYTAFNETTTYTYGFDIVKTDNNNTLIDGAKFRVYDAATDGNEIAFIASKVEDGKVTEYRIANEDETGEEIVVAGGKVRVVGLDNGTYYLEETATPNGYNTLAARQSFTISDENLYATFTGEIYSKGSGVHVINKTGSMLPETGGMGTMMFIVIGTITVLGAGILLVTKKRMSMIED